MKNEKIAYIWCDSPFLPDIHLSIEVAIREVIVNPPLVPIKTYNAFLYSV